MPSRGHRVHPNNSIKSFFAKLKMEFYAAVVRLKKKWGGQEKFRKNLIGDKRTFFLSIIDLYNPISDIENIQFIMWRYAKTPRSDSGVQESCERSEQGL